MHLILTFHSLAKQVPDHKEEILYFDTSAGLHNDQSGNLLLATVTYLWDDLLTGDPPAPSYTYEVFESSPTEELKNLRLVCEIGEQTYPVNEEDPAKANIYWLSVQDFWKSFPKPSC